MNDLLVFWFIVAVLIFWSIGAYNRLIRFRSKGVAAFGNLERLFTQYLWIVNANLPVRAGAASHEYQATDAVFSAWRALAAAAQQFNDSLQVAHAQPLDGPAMSALRTALETFWLSWSRLRDLPLNVNGAALPGTVLVEWDHVAFQAELARSDFNKAVTSYNEAIGQFPALLLARLFGFRSAQPI